MLEATYAESGKEMKSAQRNMGRTILWGACCCILAVITAFMCKRDLSGEMKERTTMPFRDINEVMQAHTAEMMALSGVVGIYIGETEDGRVCIKVMVREKTDELEQKIPKTLEGYPVLIDVTGEIKPMPQKEP